MPSRKKEKKLIRSLDAVGFYSDFDKPGSLFAALVRSPSPVGRIKSVSISDLPEGYFFFTEKDVPGAKALKVNKTMVKVFGSKNINYAGEPLGIIAGPEERVVLSLLDKVSVNLAVENFEAALENAIQNAESKDANESFSDVLEQINEMPSLNAVITKSEIEENPNITIATREVRFGLYKVMNIQKADELIFGNPVEKTQNAPKTLPQKNAPPEKTENFAEISDENQKFDKPSNQIKTDFRQYLLNDSFFDDENFNMLSDAEKTEILNKELIIFDDAWEQELSAQRWEETKGVFCYTEGADIHIYVPTKWTYFTHNAVAEVLGINLENVFIHKTKSSGSFPTGLWQTTQIALQAAVASYITKKPIKLALSQQEQNLFMKPGVSAKFSYKVAAEPDGRIFAMKINVDVDVGADNPFAQEITDRITLASCNFYKTKNLYVFTNTHTSRKPPTTISIKVADSQAFFAIENEIQKISNHINILPNEIRLINANIKEKNQKSGKQAILNDKSDFPFDIQVGNVEETLTAVIKSSDFNRKYASFQMEAKARLNKNAKTFFALPLRGIGLASGYVVSGYNGNSAFDYNSKIEVTLTTEDKVIIQCIKPSDDVQKIWKKTACEILQIPAENVVINSEFQIDQLPENPEDTISSLGIMNELIKRCCSDIQKKRFHQPLPITAKRSVPRTSKAKWNKDEFVGTPYLATSFAATVVEIELDTYTYNEKIKGIWVAIDCGEVFDEEAAVRTIKLEIQQELGMLVKDKTMPCDKIHIDFIKSNNKSGQIGALIHNTLPAAFSSALSLALATQLTKLPCTEDLLFNLIQNRTKA